MLSCEGHLFAIYHQVQWRHPLVEHAEDFYDEKNRNCSVWEVGKKLKIFPRSGYKGSTVQAVWQFRVSVHSGEDMIGEQSLHLVCYSSVVTHLFVRILWLVSHDKQHPTPPVWNDTLA